MYMHMYSTCMYWYHTIIILLQPWKPGPEVKCLLYKPMYMYM